MKQVFKTLTVSEIAKRWTEQEGRTISPQNARRRLMADDAPGMVRQDPALYFLHDIEAFEITRSARIAGGTRAKRHAKN